MTKESLPENDSSVKDKRRTRRVVPPGVPRKLKDFPKLSKRAKAGREAPGYLFKADFIDWLAGHPGMTHAFIGVARVIVSHYRFKLGRAWPSIQYIAEMSHANVRTVDRAVSFFHEQGIIFTESGGLGGRGLKRSSQYVPQFRLILNDTTGAINISAPYLTSAENWAVAGVNFPANARGCAELVRQIDPPKAVRHSVTPTPPTNRQKDGELVRHSDVLRSDSVVGRSASANADALSGATASEKKESGILPPDSENVKIFFIQFESLALACVTGIFENCGESYKPNYMIELIDNATNEHDLPRGNVEFLREWCESGAGEKTPPNYGIEYQHIVLHGDKTPMTCDKGNAGDLDGWEPETWLAIEYRIADNSPAV